MKKVLLGLVALIVVFVLGLTVAIATFDPNKYKAQIVTMLEKQTGRTVKLDGPLKLGLSLQGVTLSVNNAAIGNPSWASRPEMASIGELDLGIALFPLIDKKLVVTGLKVSKADIQLETNKNGQSNTDFQPTSATPAKPVAQKTPPASSASPVAISVDHLSVKDSRLAMRDKDGATSVYTVDSLTLGREGIGAAVHFSGSVSGTAVTADVKTGASNLLTDKNFTFDAEATYADYKFSGDGKIDLNKKTVALSSYKLEAGHSTLSGALSAGWGGAKSTAQGNAQSASLDIADFKPPAAAGGKAAPAAPSEPASGRVFSDAPFDFSGLKSADAHFDIKLAEVKTGNATLKNVAGKIILSNGTLTVDFPGVQFGNSSMNLKATVDAATSPARVDVAFAAPSVDFTDLLTLAQMKDFMSGKANASFSLTTAGNSLHDMASHANGSFTVISDGGKISEDALQGIYSGLATLVSAGSGGSSIGFTCMAARFNIKDGVMADNGILADTTASVVKGAGNVNLGAETNDLTISSKPKAAGKYGNLIPPVHIGGTLLKPSYNITASSLSSVAQNVAGLFMKGGTVTSTVPDVSGPAGQNACVYTLDHPAAAKPAANNANGTSTGNAAKPVDQLKNMGNQLMQGLLGGKH